MATTKKDSLSLTVPIDASQAEGGGAPVKVALVDAEGRVAQSQVVKTDGKKGSATFRFDELPRGARVVIGPADADDEALSKLETLSVGISPRLFAKSSSATLQAILIPAYYWIWWRRWCRTFVITGKVVCANGKPVPGAQVCALDVDWFWFWQSTQQIGCAVTDANGTFTIKFRWCCGWYPWWWWYLRTWKLDYKLASAVLANLPPELKVKPIRLPGPTPDLAFIESLIPATRFPGKLGPVVSPREQQRRTDLAAASPAGALNVLESTTNEFIARAETLRPVLAELVPQFAKLSIWPWWPWHPWRDCNPDVIFQVTQPCGGELKVIVDQDFTDAQWNISESHNVTLVANDQACCSGDVTDCGDPCLSITHVCNIDRDNTDQNDPSVSITSGFAFPGDASPLNPISADRPFAERVTLQGLPECMGKDVDWYELVSEFWDDSSPSPSWGPPTSVPGVQLEPIVRSYFTSGVSSSDSRTFTPTLVDGRWVYPARKTLEATLAAPWICLYECHVLAVWKTGGLPDGRYRLHINAYKEGPAGTLTLQTLPPCHEDDPNQVIVAVDNRSLSDPAHVPPFTPGHPCGGTTVHLCTTEPDVDIEAVRIIRKVGPPVPIVPCEIYERMDGDEIEIDYLVSDSDEHLGYYTLDVEFGESESRNLLTGTVLSAHDLGVAVGPRYWNALQPVPNQGATAPDWPGGRMRVRIPASQMDEKFPYRCCYQLELYAYKRTIVSCDTDFDHSNRTNYSFFY
jgi:hypothetical protein